MRKFIFEENLGFGEETNSNVEDTIIDWIHSTFDDGEVRESVGKWFQKRGYELNEPVSEVPDGTLDMVKDNAMGTLDPNERPDLGASLGDGTNAADRHTAQEGNAAVDATGSGPDDGNAVSMAGADDSMEESATPKFDSALKAIWECMSTGMEGNSQPTAGVFSGDNFANGDVRVPFVMGGYSRMGKPASKKRKRRSGEPRKIGGQP